MANPFVFELKTVTNDVIKSKEISPTFTGGNKKGAYNAYRVDSIEVLIAAHAGIAIDDYICIELDYEDLNGDALADLKDIDDKEYIERQMIGPIKTEITANYGFVEILDPAKKPLKFKFQNAFCVRESFFINFLVHGLASTRDCQFILRGNPVVLNPIVLKAHTNKTFI